MATVRVFAKIESKAGNEEAIRAAMAQLVAASRAESGVLVYELYETVDGGVYLVNEEYKDQASFDAHMASEHFKEAARLLTPLIAGGLSIWQTKLVV